MAHQSKESADSSNQHQSVWPLEKIGKALNAEVAPAESPHRHGKGSTYLFGQQPDNPYSGSLFQLYPEARVGRFFIPPYGELYVSNLPTPHVGRDAVLFEQRTPTDHTSLLIHRSGALYLSVEPPEMALPSMDELLSLNTLASTEHSLVQDPVFLDEPGAKRSKGKEKQPPVKVTGKVKSDPEYGISDKTHAPYLRFSVVVTGENGEESSQYIYTTKTRAERYKDQLHEGQLVTVTGQQQIHERHEEDGSAKVVDGVPQTYTVLYAYGIKPHADN